MKPHAPLSSKCQGRGRWKLHSKRHSVSRSMRSCASRLLLPVGQNLAGTMTVVMAQTQSCLLQLLSARRHRARRLQQQSWRSMSQHVAQCRHLSESAIRESKNRCAYIQALQSRLGPSDNVDKVTSVRGSSPWLRGYRMLLVSHTTWRKHVEIKRWQRIAACAVLDERARQLLRRRVQRSVLWALHCARDAHLVQHQASHEHWRRQVLLRVS